MEMEISGCQCRGEQREARQWVRLALTRDKVQRSKSKGLFLAVENGGGASKGAWSWRRNSWKRRKSVRKFRVREARQGRRVWNRILR